MNRDEKLSGLRAAMKREGIDAYVILTSDPHATEYLPEHWQCRTWLTGFTGSAGSVVVTHNEAWLWADGRYHIQAKNELEGCSIGLQKLGLDGVPSLPEWIKDNLPEKAVVGIDGRTIPLELYRSYEKEFKKKKLAVVLKHDLLSEIWKDRPRLPDAKVFEHDIKFAGKTRPEKLAAVRSKMKHEGADSYLIASIDDIAWLFNFRGGDTPNLPAVYSYAFITNTNAYLFIDSSKLPPSLAQNLAKDGVTVKEYGEIHGFLKSYDKAGNVFIDPNRISVSLCDSLPLGITVFEGPEISGWLKSVKNSVEIENTRRAYARDCAAVVKFIKWVKEAVHNETVEEADIHDKVNGFRAQGENFMGPSFSTLAQYKENAAKMHYIPAKGKSEKLLPEGFLLVDTGGQYFDGTTDITRTIVLGKISDEMKKDFTLTLKSVIRLSMAKFMYGAFASTLDILARGVMWEHGMDYKCGTGHGVGFCLNVHESPPSFRYNPTPAMLVKLEEGMNITNEPGVYKEGKWGIRTENTLLVVKDFVNSDGTFLKFDTLSYCPVDYRAIDKSLLSESELEWLNNYHAKTYETLAPFLNEEEKAWLKEETKAI